MMYSAECWPVFVQPLATLLGNIAQFCTYSQSMKPMKGSRTLQTVLPCIFTFEPEVKSRNLTWHNEKMAISLDSLSFCVIFNLEYSYYAIRVIVH
jgi:hypothetical protein